ncbi:Methyltransferase domain-containing protein [Actinopolyspora mzabensis]|uniref:Methyltransferase domain-containing protein n=1 Tax=Actinopolyspora mzabensis TaxID=995066 RepID=A0A1G9EG69_ACTMZ|nr:class I SAM-dependent methyltransferase [Actinopolyspora mzabensis]SDK75149.1 Methyltransferase domain-containing protein [Actinopolyspora mzabensis]
MSVKRWTYNLLYRVGAPWEGPVRPELVELVESQRINPVEQHSVLDMGCGSGTCSVYLAERGFDVVGVDFTSLALRKARQAAFDANVARCCRFVHGDLRSSTLPGVDGTFDLVLDFGTLDDLTGQDRLDMAANIKRHTHEGSMVVFWCFYTAGKELPRFRFNGVSRFHSAIRPGEEHDLFGDAFTIERLPDHSADENTACFLLTRQ